MRYYAIARRILPKRIRQAIVQRVKAQPVGIKRALSGLATEIKLAREVRRSTKSLESLRGRKGIKLHLGCGPIIKTGWVNIDLTLEPPEVNQNSGTVFVNYDLRLGLPLEDESCELIYSAHFFEHLEYKDGLQLLRECHRALQPGGIFRISLPFFKGMFDAYLRGDSQYFDLLDLKEVLPDIEPGTEALVDIVNLGVYQFGEHKCVYDEEKVVLVLKKIGYSSVAPSPFNPDLDPEEPVRQRYSFYVEAIK